LVGNKIAHLDTLELWFQNINLRRRLFTHMHESLTVTIASKALGRLPSASMNRQNEVLLLLIQKEHRIFIASSDLKAVMPSGDAV
jgi:uncharacterized membrane protein